MSQDKQSSAREGVCVAKVVIPTANLDLVLQSPDEVLAWIASLPPTDRAEVSPDWIARVRATPDGDPWSLGFTVVERVSGSGVGSCGFKGPPDADGVVEVAYGIDPAHRGLGFATEAAEALVGFAFRSGLVRLVRAHTKPDGGASMRVLAKCGFRRVGEVTNPEDGLVCRWERGL
jgi:[ribosomal protein S5]-alanine N-acetyltransferase